MDENKKLQALPKVVGKDPFVYWTLYNCYLSKAKYEPFKGSFGCKSPPYHNLFNPCAF